MDDVVAVPCPVPMCGKKDPVAKYPKISVHN